MDVVFRILGKIVVNNMTDTIDMYATPRDVGCNQYTYTTGFKPLERFGAFNLRHLAGQDTALKPLLLQSLVNSAHLISAISKNDH